MRARRGFTMIELMIALTLSGILGLIVTKILVSTSRFYGHDAALRNARTVARGALGLIESELRMVEVSNGVISADSATIRLRVPYAMGVLCTSGGASAVVSLLPVDSLAYAGAGFSGFAWRDAAGAWTRTETGSAVGVGSAATCTGASVTALSGGKTVALTPVPTAAPQGAAVMLYQIVTYRFATSTILPGRRALWRDVAATGVSEELVVPFDESARFRFYALNADTAQNAVPSPIANTRGIELVLNGASERVPLGRTTVATAGLTTAVFFRNRVN